MATTTLQRGAGIRRGRWLVGGIVLIALVIIVALLINTLARPAPAPSISTTTAARGPIVATVAGSGAVAAVQTLDMAFTGSGTVAEVLVQEGDSVVLGQPLARLDTRDLQLQVASAQAALDSANTKLQQTRDGDVQPADLSAQQAAVASAQAQLRSAQAQLNALTQPTGAEQSQAQLSVTQAQNALDTTRITASKAKTDAQLDVEVAANALRDAQDTLSKSYWDTHNSDGTFKKGPNDRGYQDDVDSYNAAVRAEQDAATKLQQAQLVLDQAARDEGIDIADAEAKLADAQRQLEALNRPGTNDVAQQQAAVDQARAGVAQAQANLAALTAPGTESNVAIQQAAVAQAEQSLKQAQLALDNATMTAPFAGLVTAVNIVPGSSASGATAAISLIDRSTLHVDLKLSENDVAAVQLGQPVDLTIDALKGWKTQGTVSYISPAAETNNGVVTYAVRVSFPDTEERVKVGMTANLVITTAEKDDALLVPNSALLPKGAGRVVQLPNADGTIREVEVQTGLTDGSNTEITGGLNEGDRVVTIPSAGGAATSSQSGLPGFGRR